MGEKLSAYMKQWDLTWRGKRRACGSGGSTRGEYGREERTFLTIHSIAVYRMTVHAYEWNK
jgi:hypothetical protein